MNYNEQDKTGEAQKRFCPKRYIKRLQAEGFIQWDSCTWIHPKDIPVFVAKGKINRARRRRAILMAERAEAKTMIESVPK